MPLSVRDLKPGDRVVLKCPIASLTAKREAIFEGLVFPYAGAVWARFMMMPESDDAEGELMVLTVDANGSMRREERRCVFIERRVAMGQG